MIICMIISCLKISSQWPDNRNASWRGYVTRHVCAPDPQSEAEYPETSLILSLANCTLATKRLQLSAMDTKPEPEPLLALDLFFGADEGAGYRYETLSRLDERELAGLTFVVALEHEVHGYLEGGQGDRASLLVMTFLFRSENPNRQRFREAQIWLRFEKAVDEDEGDEPVVEHVYPNSLYFNATSRDSETQNTVGVGAWMGSPLGPISTQPYIYRKTDKVSLTDTGFVYGSTRRTGKEGLKGNNTAYFTLSENPRQGAGLPSQLTVAVVIRHKTARDRFGMHAKVEAKTGLLRDLRARLQSIWGGMPREQLVEFSYKKAGKEVEGIDTDNIRNVDMSRFFKIISPFLVKEDKRDDSYGAVID